jgi:hypothetical protein
MTIIIGLTKHAVPQHQHTRQLKRSKGCCANLERSEGCYYGKTKTKTKGHPTHTSDSVAALLPSYLEGCKQRVTLGFGGMRLLTPLESRSWTLACPTAYRLGPQQGPGSGRD